MTTVRDIITAGMQQARIIPLGREPKAKEAERGLWVIQAMYDAMFADGPLGPFTDVYATTDYTAEENERIIADNVTITIPDTIIENGVTRTPKDLTAIIVVTDTTQKNYVFSLGRWQVCDGLTLDSDAPLANRDQQGLAALFAMEFAEMFGAELPPAIMRRALMFKGKIAAKHSTKKDDPVFY